MESFEKWPILAEVNTPADVKALSDEGLEKLASEIRDYLVFRVSENGGHLASNLGVVELTLALHRVFDLPRDRIIFDVGHQSYVHKLLTGRKERFDTLRQSGGISGFTKRAESEYDAFGAGHSSTALSAAIGMARADRLAGRDTWTVAVVGDGALTGGLAYEGLNNCDPDLRLILVINENEMSISPNTGRFAQYLSHLRGSQPYIRTKEITSGVLRRVPLVGKGIYRAVRFVKRKIRHMVYRENLFEHMGIRYMGPIDGNDRESVETTLRHAKRFGRSVILHVKTVKGKGYAPAEKEPGFYHGIAPAGVVAGESYSAAMGKALCRFAEEREELLAITAAMADGTGLVPFQQQFPPRFFDVGIAEGHALTFAAGLAAGGKHPVVALYSTFLHRGYDNLLHDAALQSLPVVLCLDRAGFSAADGPTHHGVFDVALFSTLHGVTMYAPVTLAGVSRMLAAALDKNGVAALRYPSGAPIPAIGEAFYPDGEGDDMPIGVRVWESGKGAGVTVVTHGRMAAKALAAAEELLEEGISVRILLAEYLMPYGDLAADVAPLLSGGAVLFLEEEIRAGGFGMNLCDALSRQGALEGKRFEIMAAEHGFLTPEKGETAAMAAGLDTPDVVRALRRLSGGENKGGF